MNYSESNADFIQRMRNYLNDAHGGYWPELERLIKIGEDALARRATPPQSPDVTSEAVEAAHTAYWLDRSATSRTAMRAALAASDVREKTIWECIEAGEQFLERTTNGDVTTNTYGDGIRDGIKRVLTVLRALLREEAKS